MRELTETERFMRLMTEYRQREQFMIHCTSTMPEFEDNGWTIVYPIRYTGSTGTNNTFGL